jgi:hypothetical protein
VLDGYRSNVSTHIEPVAILGLCQPGFAKGDHNQAKKVAARIDDRR